MPERPQQPDEFRTTQWSLVHRAAGAAGLTLRGEALSELLNRYLPALRSHLVVRWRIAPDRADDLIQGFLVRKILEYDLLARADQSRGKFRTLLLTSLDNYVRNELSKRENRGSEPMPEDLPDDAPDSSNFDVPWAKALLTQALQRMKSECEANGREDLWAVFDARILAPTLRDEPPMEYVQLVERFKFASPAQASNVLITSKRMFERILRGLICEYTGDADEVESELADLRQVLSGAAK